MSTVKWNAGGFYSLACITGFKAPSNEDPSGMWVHDKLGKFHDSIMPAIVLEYINYRKWLKSVDITEYNLQSIRINLESVGEGLEEILKTEQCQEKLRIIEESLDLIYKVHGKIESII